MYKTAFAIIASIFISACGHRQPEHANEPGKDTLLYYTYSPVYSSAFNKGNPFYAQQVLNIWKELESGDILHVANKFADSITIIFPDRIMIGKRDSLLLLVKKRRQAFKDVQFYVDGWMPVQPTEKTEQLVFVWGRQDFTARDGKREYKVLHEIWRFNPSGKITSWEQYQTHPY